MTDAAAAAATYFDAWKARDFARLRSVLADDVAGLGVGQGEAAVDFQRGAGGVTVVGLDESIVDALGLSQVNRNRVRVARRPRRSR
jgi:hypothetical protein